MKTIALTPENARALIVSFLDGATTPAQERALYTFFRNNPAGTLPPDLERHRAMMAWYDAITPAAPAEAPRRHRRFGAIAGIAAAVAVLLAVGVAIIPAARTADSADQLYASYSGSYVVRNGKRVTDIQAIYSILQQAEITADSLERAADAQARLIEDAAKNIFLY